MSLGANVLYGNRALYGVVNLDSHASVAAGLARLEARARCLNLRVASRLADGVGLGIASRDSALASDDWSLDQRRSLLGAVVGEMLTTPTPEGAGAFRAARLADVLEVADAESPAKPFVTANGTYAFAVSERSKRTTIGTNRRGGIPVFYRVEQGQLFFGSLLSLLAGSGDAVDPQAVQEFLRFLYIGAPRTIYRDVRRLEPGCCLVIEHGVVGVLDLEQPPLPAVPAQMSLADAMRGLEDVILRSVTARFGSRKVGLLLSSGVDSAMLAAARQKTDPGNTECFTVGFDRPELDEAEAAGRIAGHLGIAHHVLRFSAPAYAEAFGAMAAGFDQPFADPACLPLALAARAAADRVEVLADGTGADGDFGAPIPRALKFSLDTACRLPRWQRRLASAILRGTHLRRPAGYADLFDFADIEDLFITWNGWSRAELRDLCGSDAGIDDSLFYRSFRRDRTHSSQAVYDAIAVFPPDDSRFEAAGLSGIPISLVYHDPDVTAFLRTLPASCRYSAGETKFVLRRVLAQYVPETTKKHYFKFPLAEFLLSQAEVTLKRYLTREVLQRCNVVNPEMGTTYLRRFEAGAGELVHRIWALLVLHAWLEARPRP